MIGRYPAALLAAWALALLAHAHVRADDRNMCVSTHEDAQHLRLQGRLLEAREGLQSCARTDCPRVVREDCGALLSDLEQSLPTVQFAVEDELGTKLEDVRVEVDGRPLPVPVSGPPVPIDPGVHTLRFIAGGRAPNELQVTVYQGQKGRVLEVRLLPVALSVPQESVAPTPAAESDAAASSERWLRTSYAVASAAIAAFVVTGATALRGHRMQQRCENDGCSDGYAQRGMRLYRTVNGSAIAGGVLVAGAVGAFWTGRMAQRRERDATVSAALSTAGATLWVSHRF
jgi:hypothetical protein